jgi:hypothetical protein
MKISKGNVAGVGDGSEDDFDCIVQHLQSEKFLSVFKKL